MRHIFLKLQNPVTKKNLAVRMTPQMRFVDDVEGLGLETPHLIQSYVYVTVPDGYGSDDGDRFDEDELKTSAIINRGGIADFIPKSELKNIETL